MQSKSGNVATELDEEAVGGTVLSAGTATGCPNCRKALREGANYCYHCGWELRPPCPNCSDRYPLPALDSAPAPRCPNHACEVARYVCSRCGRPMTTDERYCASRADRGCQGVAVPVHPQHTGRNARGSGTAEEGLWPAQRMPQATLDVWRGETLFTGPISAAFAANGTICLWSGPRLWEIGSDQPLLEAGEIALPALAAHEERVALAGRRAVLATPERYLFVDMARRYAPEAFPGAPIAQCGWLDLWAGWCRNNERMHLHIALCGADGGVARETLDGEGKSWSLRPGGRIIAHDRALVWPGCDGRLWQISRERREPQPLSEQPLCADTTVRLVAGSTEDALWVAAEELTGESRMPLRIRLTALAQDGVRPCETPLIGPLRGLHAAPDRVVVVGANITHIAPTTGGVLDGVAVPTGAYGPAFLARTALSQPLLCMAVSEWSDDARQIVRLMCHATPGSAPVTLWSGRCDDLRALIPYKGGALLVATGSIIRLAV